MHASNQASVVHQSERHLHSGPPTAVACVIILLETLALFGLSSFEVPEHDIRRGAALGLASAPG